jgi:DNA-binding IscR family transcriptional regulator
MSARNIQFSVAVHVVTALAYYRDLKSERLIQSVNAQPAVVRKVLSKLAKAGLLNAIRGKNGSTKLARDPSKITLLDIYHATQPPPVFAIHDYPVESACAISRSHKGAMNELLLESQKVFEANLARKNITKLVNDLKSKGK